MIVHTIYDTLKGIKELFTISTMINLVVLVIIMLVVFFIGTSMLTNIQNQAIWANSSNWVNNSNITLI